MGFVRSEAELEEIRGQIERHEFRNVRILAINYRTDPSVIEEVLPPGLTPDAEPIAQAAFAHVERSPCGPYSGTHLLVRARHEDIRGWYMLWMAYSTDVSVLYGRELLGEPKKQGVISVTRNGRWIDAEVLRYGSTVMQADVELVSEVSPETDGGDPKFTYKYLSDISGYGFQGDPLLITIDSNSEIRHVEIGEGSLELSSADPDPLGELEVNGISTIKYIESDITANGGPEILAQVDGAEYEPYFYGTNRIDDLLSINDDPTIRDAVASDTETLHGRSDVRPGWHGFE